MGQPTAKKGNIADLKEDTLNANKGTVFGDVLLEKSLRRSGLGRSILIDKHGNVIAGNKTLGKAAELGIEETIVVPSDGTKLVVVQRTDIDLDSAEGRALALADNKVSEVNLAFDAGVLLDIGAKYNLDLPDMGFGDLMPTEDRKQDNSEFNQTAESYMNGAIRQIVLYYDVPTHKMVLDILERLGVKYECPDDNSTVILKLLEEIGGSAAFTAMLGESADGATEALTDGTED